MKRLCKSHTKQQNMKKIKRNYQRLRTCRIRCVLPCPKIAHCAATVLDPEDRHEPFDNKIENVNCFQNIFLHGSWTRSHGSSASMTLSTALGCLEIPTTLKPQPSSNLVQWSSVLSRPDRTFISCRSRVVIRLVAPLAGRTIS